ncbi:hypothetical protein A3G67_00730 [Candidatus Roizmanbacteria bacterium RIFCSPLOWO2_12_FULL_40_12]|nr:MAG: hypothetical protein A3C31_03095 [Candidatus Roizmanbacteria bacterium RIFCSPHIGHO2_02_FULL_40_53]OGK30136.1 MAG: hypothetical protein A2W49_04540 [Candidatus Roizmanbacteria bacterium RIFCSPHIGHO2_12_41_18]OGK61346.1 MAG: hypothetical protein A3G67_00730 [Candidatus Roizmanbacteria bacterium RIFCSPLOWO2_12_FULL_40_12]
MKPHFYNLRSRLGLTNVPYRQKSLNFGVEKGGDAVLSKEFLQNFHGAVVDEFDFSKPEETSKKNYYDILAKELKGAKNLILDSLSEDETAVALGGDNSISFSPLAAMLERYKPNRVGYVRIDSHPDMNSIKVSPSGNFHGMWMRPFVDDFEEKKISNLIKNKLTLYQLLFIGNLDIDSGEKEFFTGKSTVFSPGYLRENKESALMNLEQFANIYEHIYLGIDIDGFDASIAPATGIPAKSGLLLTDVQEVFEKVKEQLVCVDLVEVNPEKKGAAQTVKLAQTILLSLLR